MQIINAFNTAPPTSAFDGFKQESTATSENDEAIKVVPSSLNAHRYRLLCLGFRCCYCRNCYESVTCVSWDLPAETYFCGKQIYLLIFFVYLFALSLNILMVICLRIRVSVLHVCETRIQMHYPSYKFHKKKTRATCGL